MFRSARKPKGESYKLRLEPTTADREYVRTLSRRLVPVRVICQKLGARFGIGKPMSFLTLYHHFRDELVRRPTRVLMPTATGAEEDVGAILEKLRARRK